MDKWVRKGACAKPDSLTCMGKERTDSSKCPLTYTHSVACAPSQILNCNCKKKKEEEGGKSKSVRATTTLNQSEKSQGRHRR